MNPPSSAEVRLVIGQLLSSLKEAVGIDVEGVAAKQTVLDR